MKYVQNQTDSRGVEIQKVGIKDFELPIVIQRKDAENKVIYASATCGVTLPAHYKGTHMSRFVEVLNEWRTKKLLGVDIRGCLEEVIKRHETGQPILLGTMSVDTSYVLHRMLVNKGLKVELLNAENDEREGVHPQYFKRCAGGCGGTAVRHQIEKSRRGLS